MNSSVEGFTVELNVDTEATESVIEVTGNVALHAEENDTCVVLNVEFAADVKILRYTRNEVLDKLARNFGIAASMFGYFSEQAQGFERDIEAVKNGGDLYPHAWMFE